MPKHNRTLSLLVNYGKFITAINEFESLRLQLSNENPIDHIAKIRAIVDNVSDTCRALEQELEKIGY